MTREEALEAISGTNVTQITAALSSLSGTAKLKDLPAIMQVTKKNMPASVIKKAQDTLFHIIRNNLVEHYHELAPAMRSKLAQFMSSLDPSVVDRLSRDVYSAQETERVRAVQILGLLHTNPRVKDVLTKLLNDKSQHIRATAVSLLGKLIKHDDMQPVFAVLNDKDARVRANTIEALEHIGGKRVVPVLMRFRNDPNNRIRGNALKALHTVADIDISEDLMKMLQAKSNFMKASALWVVSQTGCLSRAIEEKAGYLFLSEDEMVSANARKALRTLATPKAKGFLRYLGDEDPDTSQPQQTQAAHT